MIEVNHWQQDEDDPNIYEGPQDFDMADAPQRAYTIRHCTDLAIEDIVLYDEEICTGQKAPCDWYGSFRVIAHNQVDDTLTYSWSVTPGRVIGTSVEKYMKMAFNATRDTEISVTCSITGTNGSDTLTINHRTNHSGRIEQDDKIFKL